ncbi:serine protease HtrA [Tepidimicrobium xylanilyticum]|uniref:Serine protease, S1-C subfamily, contains C-terminal PDZ domain n=1 Tax=Tepidimicrobium xylanilyticum TaxID=1123352 RepID=A0A1H3AL23_9FIRM|nr:trypsin-like peptidase domain-containing protein [Tepidimicrobium xylanilyticum]GMG98094.1 protease [Tepidimicrobium xylanilyticum]SDX30387.1 serine protease, S1-C subfamily, contains C-terminal PDZ domain [Tepidimicrobium xylanilyticum]
MYFERPPRRRGVFSYFIVALIGAIIGGVISVYIAPNYLYGKIIPMPEIYQNREVPINQGQQINITPIDDITTVEAVAKKAMSFVVGITTVQVQREFFWAREVSGVGSGVIVDPNGYILTNSHVVADGDVKQINVLFENGDTLPGQVLWNDAALDLAIVKVEAMGLPTADLGNSDSLEVGQLAVAIGNPLGLDFQRTVTAGVISGLDRTIRTSQYSVLEGLIQTDASINRGNSGGPLLNSKGEVIGINTVKIGTQVGEGLGFAIPINVAKPIIKEVVEKGDFKAVYLGIAATEVERYEREWGVDLSIDKGIIIIEISPNTPADKAGLRPGDIITHIDNQELQSMNQLKKILYKYKKGDKASLMVVRNGKQMTINITFSEVR